MGGGVTPWMARQGFVEASTHRGLDTSLLEEHMDDLLTPVVSLNTSTRVCLYKISSVDEAL